MRLMQPKQMELIEQIDMALLMRARLQEPVVPIGLLHYWKFRPLVLNPVPGNQKKKIPTCGAI